MGGAAGVERKCHIAVWRGLVGEVQHGRALADLADLADQHRDADRVMRPNAARMRQHLDMHARRRDRQVAQGQADIGGVVDGDRILDRLIVAVVEGPVARRDDQRWRRRERVVGQRQRDAIALLDRFDVP